MRLDSRSCRTSLATTNVGASATCESREDGRGGEGSETEPVHNDQQLDSVEVVDQAVP